MKKIEQLRDQHIRIKALMMLMPGAARDAIGLLMDTIEEQQQSIDLLTREVNRLTEKEGDAK